MAKVLVTGAGGFIGSHVTRLLCEQGRDVRALVRPGEKTTNIDRLKLEKVTGDILDPAAVEAALKGCDTLYHLAAIYAIWTPDDKIIYDVNVKGTEIVLEAAKKAGLKKVVYTSSIAAVGIGTPGHPATEETPWNYGWAANAYIRSKYQSQLVALRYARQGLPVVIVNPGFPIGEQDIAPTPTGQIVVDVINKKVPVAFDGGISVIDVRDVAMGHILAETKGRVGEVYLLSNRNISILDLYKMVGKVAGIKTPTIVVPSSLILGLAAISEFVSDHITHKHPITTFKSVLVSTKKLHYDSSKAIRELGLPQTPIEEALKRSIDWFKANGYTK